MRDDRELLQQRIMVQEWRWSLDLDNEYLGSNGRIDECIHGLAAENNANLRRKSTIFLPAASDDLEPWRCGGTASGRRLGIRKTSLHNLGGWKVDRWGSQAREGAESTVRLKKLKNYGTSPLWFKEYA